MKILFVCTGNTCRSQMAQGICEKLYSNRIERCESAGLFTMGGEPVAENAVLVCREIKVDISSNKSKSISVMDLNDFDKIVVMTKAHSKVLSELSPDTVDKIYVPHQEIADPYGGSVELYRACRDQIIEMIDKLMGEINA